MSRRAFATVVILGEDGSQSQAVWELTDEDAAHTLTDQLGGLLGDPVCEAVLCGSVVAAIRAASDASGGPLVVYAGDVA